jgi:hypothetical protein
MYYQGVAKLRLQSVERSSLSEVNDAKFQLNKLIARTNILSSNTKGCTKTVLPSFVVMLILRNRLVEVETCLKNNIK